MRGRPVYGSTAVTAAVALLLLALPAQGQRCFNTSGDVSAICVVDPHNRAARGGFDLSVAFDRPGRREPADSGLSLRGFPLAVLAVDLDGGASSAADDVVFLDQSGIWTVLNNSPQPGLLTVGNAATLSIPLEALLLECASDIPPCDVVPPEVTGALLGAGDFDGDLDEDLAVYIQAESATSGTGERPSGTLVYLDITSNGGLQIQKRHPTIGGDALDLLVEDFDGDGVADDVALLFELSVVVIPSCGSSSCTMWSTPLAKQSIAMAPVETNADQATDLIILAQGAGDPEPAAAVAVLRSQPSSSGFAVLEGYEFRVASLDVLTDVEAVSVSGTEDLAVVASATRGSEGRLYWFPFNPQTLVPAFADAAVVTFEGGASQILVADLGPRDPGQFDGATDTTPPALTLGIPDLLVVGDGAAFRDAAWNELDVRAGRATLIQGPFLASEMTGPVAELDLTSYAFRILDLVNSQWELVSLLDDAVDDIPPRSITDVSLGQFDLEPGPDVVVSDGSNGELVFLRTQPPPCATYISVGVQGHNRASSLGLASGEEVWMDPLLTSLSTHVRVINDARRSSAEDAAVNRCPVRHIEVRGDWMDATNSEGAQRGILASRVSWALSQYGVAATLVPWIPDPTGIVLGLEPVRYWASWAFLAHALYTPAIADRIVLAAIGHANESLSTPVIERVSAGVAAELSSSLVTATTMARNGMDPCDGQIYIDAAGYSRGGPILGESLEGVFSRSRSVRFNTKLRAVYLDAIDRRHAYDASTIRPWALSGDLMHDGYVKRHGNEVISSFEAQLPTSLDFLPPLDWVCARVDDLANAASWNLSQYPSDVCQTQMIGLPRGWDRSGGDLGLSFEETYASFCASPGCPEFAEENFPSPIPVSHGHVHWNQDEVEPTGYYWPSDLTQTTVGLPGQAFTWAENSSLGPLIADPYSHFDLPPSEVGWAPASAMTAAGFHRTDTEEREDEPVVCGGASAADPLGVDFQGSPPTCETDAAPNIHCQASKELLADESFDASASLVNHSDDYVAQKGDMEAIMDAAGMSPEDQEWFSNYISGDSLASFPANGPWRQGPRCTDASGGIVVCPDGVTVEGGDLENGDRVIDAMIRGIEGADEEETAENVEAEFLALSPDERADRARYLSSVAGGSTPGDDEALMNFPDDQEGYLEQTLPPASRALDELLVRVDVRFTEDDGFLEVALSGPNLNEVRRITPDMPLERRRETFVMGRVGSAALSLQQDTFTLVGRGVHVYRASVQPHRIIEDPSTGRWYELVYRPGGTSWNHAATLVSDLRYFDLHARLVAPTDSTTLTFLLNNFDFDAPVWMGASRVAGTDDPFLMADGTEVPSAVWATGVTPPYTSVRPLYATLDPALGGLNYREEGVTHLGDDIGFFVEYVPESELTGQEEVCLAYAPIYSSWPLDTEDASGTVFEMRGRYTMTTDGPLPVPGAGLFDPSGSSLTFDAQTVLSAPGDAAISELLSSGEYTFSFWMRTDSTSGDPVVFRVGGDGTDDDYGTNNVLLQVARQATDLRLIWEVVDSDNHTLLTTGLGLQAGEVYHVAVTTQNSPVGSNLVDVAIYVTHPTAGRVFEQAWLDQVRPLAGDPELLTVDIGGYLASASDRFDGSLDGVTLFGMPLTSVEVWELTQSTLAQSTCGAFDSYCTPHEVAHNDVVAAWFFDEGSASDNIREMAGRYPLSPDSSASPGVTAGLAWGTATQGARSFNSNGTTKMGRPIDVALRDTLASSDYSLTWWMKPTASSYVLYAGGPVGDTGGSALNILLQLQVLGDGTVRVFWERASGANVTLDTTDTLTLGQEYHGTLTVTAVDASTADVVVEVRNSSQTVVLSHQWTGVQRPVAGDISSARWVIGGRYGGTGGFAGSLDNMTLFGEPLTTEQGYSLATGEELGMISAWPLSEHAADLAAFDAMGRYPLQPLGGGLVAVNGGLNPHDLLYVGARRFDGTPMARVGSEQLSTLLADSSYTVMLTFQPDTVNGREALFFYGGPNGDGVSDNNIQLEIDRDSDEIRIWWEKGTGGDEPATTGDANLVPGTTYSIVLSVVPRPSSTIRDVTLYLANWSTMTSRTFYWERQDPTPGVTANMKLALGGRGRTVDGVRYHGVLDDVYLFAPQADPALTEYFWDAAAADYVVCSPGLQSAAVSGEGAQQSLLGQESSSVAGPAAGTAEIREESLATEQVSSEDAATSTESPTADEKEEGYGAEAAVAYGEPGGPL